MLYKCELFKECICLELYDENAVKKVEQRWSRLDSLDKLKQKTF